jgi:hypothetical protein
LNDYFDKCLAPTPHRRPKSALEVGELLSTLLRCYWRRKA